MLVYLAVAITTAGTAQSGQVLQNAADPIIQVARKTTSKAGFVFFTLGGAVLALTTTLNALFMIGTKSLLMIARDKLVPEKLGQLNPAQYQQSAFKLRGFWLWFCPLVGMLLMFFFSIIILIDLNSVWKIGWFMAFIASGIIYYQWRKRYLSKNGILIGDFIKANWDA
jgi:APA family basic amino acid/polyamine antiporter